METTIMGYIGDWAYGLGLGFWGKGRSSVCFLWPRVRKWRGLDLCSGP